MKFSNAILALMFPLATTFAQDEAVEQPGATGMVLSVGALRGT
jgi:hypothetical protein